MKNNFLKFQEPVPKRGSLAPARFLLVLFQLLAVLLVFLFHYKNLNGQVLLFGAGLVLMTLLSVGIMARFSRNEPYLLVIVNMIFTIGAIMVFRIRPNLGSRQLFIYLVSVVIFFFVFFLLRASYRFWENATWIYFALTLACFLLTLLFGRFLYGAKNWVTIAGVQIQPSEFAKVPFVFMIASWFRHYEDYQTSPLKRYSLMIAVYVLIALFFVQKELGTAMVFFSIFFMAQVAFERNKSLVVLNFLLVLVGLTLGYFLFQHVRSRVDIWLNPWADYHDKGYQIVQSLFAIAEGGFFGTGLGLGHPESVPLGYSDFIFASVVEEMGGFMGICLIFLFLLLFYRGIKIAMRQERDFYSCLALCISVLFASQALIMFGGVMKLIPLTGITIPFLTYGGSSLLSSFILLACLQLCSEDFVVREVEHEKK